MERAVALVVHNWNFKVDINRGICSADFYGSRWWEQAQHEGMWGNVDGPPPGGNLQIPPEVPVAYAHIQSCCSSPLLLVHLGTWC